MEKDDTANGGSEYVQISQGGVASATGIPWSSAVALQADEGKRLSEVHGVKSRSFSVCQSLLFDFNLV